MDLAIEHTLVGFLWRHGRTSLRRRYKRSAYLERAFQCGIAGLARVSFERARHKIAFNLLQFRPSIVRQTCSCYLTACNFATQTCPKNAVVSLVARLSESSLSAWLTVAYTFSYTARLRVLPLSSLNTHALFFLENTQPYQDVAFQ